MSSPLRTARLAKKESLIETGRACSVDPGNLSRIERGEQVPGLELVERLVKHFGGTVSELEILYPERYAISEESGGGNE